MSSTNLKTHHIARALAPIAAALVLISLGAAPSFARPDLGAHIPPTAHADGCRLQRVGAQFVRCDSLTGNGVAAPAWIPRAEATTPLTSAPTANTGRKATAIDVATFAAHVAGVGADRATLDPDGTLLPGDVRVWELNHPAGATSALLPGDVRVWELNHPAGATSALLPGDVRVWELNHPAGATSALLPGGPPA